MAATRTSINRMKLERSTARHVAPIDPAVTVYQGDALAWDTGNHVAVLAGPSATAFIGISETKNPIPTLGAADLLGNLTSARVNVIQEGRVERIAEIAETLFPYDAMTVGSDAQKACKLWATNATKCFMVDPNWAGAAGKAVNPGDLVQVWILPRPLYAVNGPAVAALS